MRYFFRQRIPPFDRVLVVESGSRYLLEELLPGLYEIYPGMRLDLVTCFAGLPRSFREDRGSVYRVTNLGPGGRGQLFESLIANNYSITGIICSGEPIMTKWKWAIAAKVPAKLFVLNENGDYFWVDRTNWSTIRHFVLFRAGLAGAGAVRTIARLLLFPATLGYLLLYASLAHLRRRLHT